MNPWAVVTSETDILRIPRMEPIRSSYATYDAFEVVLVRLRTAGGAVGTGFTNVIGTGAESIRSFCAGEYLPLVEGREPNEVKAVWDLMFRQGMSRGRKGIAMYALSAVDIALWDLLAQQAGLPLHHLLGGSRTRIPAYGNGCWLSFSMERLVEEASKYVELGCFGVKVKIGGDISEDVARVEAVREAIGPGTQLMVDANQRYDPLTALDVARRLAAFEIAWFEEPVLADSIHDQARVAEGSVIPVAAGENEYSRYGFRELIEHEAAHILQPDVHRVGGVTEFMRIAALAEAWNLPLVPHTSYELHAQLVSAVPHALGVEYHDWFPPGMFVHDFSIEDGNVALPDAPGLGTVFDPDAVSEYRV